MPLLGLLDHFAESIGCRWHSHSRYLHYVAGAFVPGDRYYDDGKCWGHVYGPLFCGKPLPKDTPLKYCRTCFEAFGFRRCLCEYWTVPLEAPTTFLDLQGNNIAAQQQQLQQQRQQQQ